MESVWLVASVVAFVLSCWWYKTLRSRPPGPWNLPIVGYLAFLDTQSPYLTLTNLAKRYGPVYGLHLGRVYTVVISDVKIIKKVFSKDLASGRAPLHLTHGIMKGYGLICAQGELWKDQRRFVSNTLRALGAARVAPNRHKMQELIMHHVRDLVQHIKNRCVDMAVDPLEALRHSLGSAINQMVFGKYWSRDDSTWQWLQHLQEEGTKHIGVAGPLNFLPFLRFLPKSKRTMRFLIGGKDETHHIYSTIIKEHQAERSRNFITAFLDERTKRPQDERDKFYNDVQFHHLLADVFGASLDTTLTTLRWFLLYMAVYEDVQNRIREELEVLSDDDFSTVPYLEAALAETQRIRSVVPVGIPHGSLEEMQVESYTIPKGTMIVPLQWAVHMDPEVWDEPEVFKPERFVDEEGKFFKPESFIPFQTGKRMCVGDELARMFLHLFGATLIKNFHISAEDISRVDLTGDCGITLTPKPQQLIFRTI